MHRELFIATSSLANILVTPEGRAKVTDFGVARLRTTQMTVAGELLGTPSFMSPEQFEGGRTDGRSDLFSLGIILYWMLTGQTPFAGDDLSEIMFRVVYKDPTPPTQVNPQLASEFDYVLRRALAKDPNNRYQSGKEFAEDLKDLLEGRAPRSQSGEPARPPVEKTIGVRPRERVSDSPVTSDRNVSNEAPASSAGASSSGPVVTVDWKRVRESTQRISQKALVAGGFVAKRAAVIAGLLWRHGVAFAKTLPRRSWTAADLAQRGWTWFRSMPRKGKLGLAVVPAVFVAWVVWSWLAFALAPKTTLSFSVRHDLRSGEFSVWVDGWKVSGGDLQGTESKRLGVFRSVEGSFSTVVNVPVGKRVVRVRVATADGGYDQTREIEADFVAGEEATLFVNCDSRRGFLVLSLH
ncbi:MAG: serine/threonine protein kinase [Verrucomicrobiales bacterium]|nr:serine/threonine protein kinase [Verrucomicrobiales bacterium]